RRHARLQGRQPLGDVHQHGRRQDLRRQGHDHARGGIGPQQHRRPRDDPLDERLELRRRLRMSLIVNVALVIARAFIADFSALLAVGPADAANTLAYGLHPSVTLGVAIPVKLVAGTQGTTTLGVNQTSATTAISLSKSAQDLSTLAGAKSVSGAGGLTKLRFR